MSVSTAVVDGIVTRYEVAGSGPPLLMFSPGGFNATLDELGNTRPVSTHPHAGAAAGTVHLHHLRQTRVGPLRRSGGAGALDRTTSNQGIGLLDHLGYERVHVMGACVGCSIATLLATTHRDRVAGMVLYSPAGGSEVPDASSMRGSRLIWPTSPSTGWPAWPRWRAPPTAGFSDDGRVGPWVTVLRSDPEFAARYVELDVDRYQTIVAGMSRLLFDRDTVPGAEPEDLLALDIPALIVPGQDSSHAPSAARYLQECLPAAQYWDVPVAEQTADTAPARVIEFLESLAF